MVKLHGESFQTERFIVLLEFSLFSSESLKLSIIRFESYDNIN